MKISDDYDAKIKLWAQNPKQQPLDPLPRMPKVRSQKFSSHAEMNAWKAELLARLAREGSGDE